MFLLLPIFCCYFFLIYLFVTAKAALPKKKFYRLLLGKLQIICHKKLKNCNFIFWPSYDISFERTSNNLACALQRFLCLFCARFALLKTVLSNRNLNKKGLKIESFLQKKKKKLFLRFFLRPPSKVTNFNTLPMPPPFENFSFDTLNSEQKPSLKKTGRPGRSKTGRPAGQPAMILKFTGQVGSRKS